MKRKFFPALVQELGTVWVPNAVWKRFIDETLAANGKKPELF